YIRWCGFSKYRNAASSGDSRAACAMAPSLTRAEHGPCHCVAVAGRSSLAGLPTAGAGIRGTANAPPHRGARSAARRLPSQEAMRVDGSMKRPVLTVKPRDSIAHARAIMEEHRVNQLPVVVDDRLVGIVTDRDLRDAFPSVFETTRPRRARGTDPAT